jgi:hypothetical protein
MNQPEASRSAYEPEFDPFPAISQRRRRGVRVTSAAAIALGLAVVGGSVAGASTSSAPPAASSRPSSRSVPTGGRPPFGGARPTVVGTVTSVGEDTFAVTALDGTKVTVDVTSSTTYVDPGVTSPMVAAVKVGEHVAVFGTDRSDTVAATRVAIGLPPGGGGKPPGGRGLRPPTGSGGTPPTGRGPGGPPPSETGSGSG